MEEKYQRNRWSTCNRYTWHLQDCIIIVFQRTFFGLHLNSYLLCRLCFANKIMYNHDNAKIKLIA